MGWEVLRREAVKASQYVCTDICVACMANSCMFCSAKQLACSVLAVRDRGVSSAGMVLPVVQGFIGSILPVDCSLVGCTEKQACDDRNPWVAEATHGGVLWGYVIGGQDKQCGTIWS